MWGCSFWASEKVKVLNHPCYSPDLSPCDFFLFARLKKMLSGNKYTSRCSLGSAIYQCLQQIPKRRLFICFSRLVKKLQKRVSVKGGIRWRFVIKICLIKRSTEVIRTQWQNFLQDPRILTNQSVKSCFFSEKSSDIKHYRDMCVYVVVGRQVWEPQLKTSANVMTPYYILIFSSRQKKKKKKRRNCTKSQLLYFDSHAMSS